MYVHTYTCAYCVYMYVCFGACVRVHWCYRLCSSVEYYFYHDYSYHDLFCLDYSIRTISDGNTINNNEWKANLLSKCLKIPSSIIK